MQTAESAAARHTGDLEDMAADRAGAVDILRIEGDVDNRGVFLSENQKHASRQIRTCVSRVSGRGVVIESDFRHDG